MKPTGFDTNMKLKKTSIRCITGHGMKKHAILGGFDAKTNLPVTALMSTYPHMLAWALINDVKDFILELPSNVRLPTAAPRGQ